MDPHTLRSPDLPTNFDQRFGKNSKATNSLLKPNVGTYVSFHSLRDETRLVTINNDEQARRLLNLDIGAEMDNFLNTSLVCILRILVKLGLSSSLFIHDLEYRHNAESAGALTILPDSVDKTTPRALCVTPKNILEMTVPPPLVAAQIVEALIVPCIRTAQSISLSANSPPSTGGVAFLYDRPKILKPNVGTIGISKGGDLALSLATYIPEVKAAVWINGCNANVQSTLHLHQGKLPGLEYDISKMQVVDGVFDTYEAVLNPEDYPETIIPIEKADANFLFLVGLADKNWKSELYADLAIKRLQKAGRDNYKVHKYEGTGHLIECPYSPYNHTVYSRLIRAPIVYGGAMVPHQQAQLQVWNTLRKFLTRFIR
ncbi:hypothetical protein Pcinc_008744 [Petrolisthes cinctipes]|uniref:BAAT/Acyl-CoA thioester hydrolase C-terminal domain-containing protein n=1 Tax=Petrolisthes cinctipes TaxID=88211 RepID=A0AAE1KW64_PETCI|nr:hypothetical protein Pcinc_008744 [Petrolisthes cinctipes]